MEKTDRNLKNTLWTHTICTTTLPTPKFRPSLILWTTSPKSKFWLTSPPSSFCPTPKFYGPTPPTPFFWPMPKFYRPTPPTQKFDPRHPRTHAPTLPTPPTLFSRLVSNQNSLLQLPKIKEFCFACLKNYFFILWWKS